MATYTIKKTSSKALGLKAANAKADWRGYVYAHDHRQNGRLRCQEGFPADLEYIADEGDTIVAVDEDGNEIETVEAE